MAYQPMFGSRHRERLWKGCCVNAFLAGRGNLPICNICDEPVLEQDDWDESHLPWKGAPARLRSVGVAHRPCNREHGRKIVVPAAAKAKRIEKRRLGLRGPGLGRHALPGGRLSRVSKTMRHGVQPRRTLAQRHAAVMAARAIVPIDVNAPSLSPEL